MPLLVIDDVQEVYRPQTKRFEPGILDFLREFRENGGQVFLLSSASSAYKIRSNSGYKLRSRVVEMQPRSSDVIKEYIKTEVNKIRTHPLSQGEIEEYYRLFNGNMLIMRRLYNDKDSTFDERKRRNRTTLKNLRWEFPAAMKLLKLLIVDIGIDFSEWINITSAIKPEKRAEIPELTELYHLVEDDILIIKGGCIFRFKNRLTENVVMSQFQDQIMDHSTKASQEAKISSL